VDSVESLPSKVTEVLSTVGKFVTSVKDLMNDNRDWQQDHLDSAPHLQSAYKIRWFLDPPMKEENQRALLKLLDLPSITLEQAYNGFKVLEEMGSETKVKDGYREAALKMWPDATIFKN